MTSIETDQMDDLRQQIRLPGRLLQSDRKPQAIGDQQVAVGSAGGAWAARLGRLGLVPPAADIEPCMRFSRTRLPDVLHRWHSASRSPRPVGSWPDDGSVEVDQPEPVRRLVDDNLHAVPPAAFVALADEPREAVHRVVVDLVEGMVGVSVTEVARPTAQEPVDVLHDRLD